MKKYVRCLAIILVLSTMVVLFSSCSAILNTVTRANAEAEFYNLTADTKDQLDVLADTIFRNWYDCIYEDKFDGDINVAIDAAYEEHEALVREIVENTATIEEYYKQIKGGRLEDVAREVMQAYNRYYLVVMETGGTSFNDYSDSKVPAEKELAEALRNYYAEC